MLGRLNEIENLVLDNLPKENTQFNELKKILRNFNFAVDTAKIGICQWNNRTGIYLANSQFRRNFDFSDSSGIEETHKLITDSFFPEDVEKAKILERKLMFGEIDSYEIDFRQKVNNKTKWWRFIVTIMDMEKGLEQELYTSVSWEITQEKETIQKLLKRENQLRELNGKLNNTITELDNANRDLSMAYNLLEMALTNNNAYAWDWNVKEGKININMPSAHTSLSVQDTAITIDRFLEKLMPEDLSKIQLGRLAFTGESETNFSIDLRIDFYGKGYTWFEFRGRVAERDENGGLIHIKGIAVNIQDRKDSEKKLVMALETANQSEKSHTDSLANIANDMYTPLNAIVGFADLLVNASDRSECKKYADAIKQSNQILQDLISVSFAQKEKAQETIEVKAALKEDNVPLWEFMAEMLQVYSMTLGPSKKLYFKNPYDSIRTLVDRAKLEEVLGILLKQAIERTLTGIVHFGYEMHSDRVVVYVSDNGVGVSMEGLALLSDRNEVDSTLFGDSTEMTFCRKLVKQMGGSVKMIAKPEGGSQVMFDLPFRFDKAQNQTMITDAEVLVKHVAKRKDLLKVMIADDNVYSAMMMKTVLEDHYHVICAEDGGQALDMYKEERPDFVFMDIRMPIMDGLEVSRKIREISTEVPIVVFTAYAVRSLKKSAALSGCTDILTKPATSKQILAMVKKHLK